jgi:hypothetical protein
MDSTANEAPAVRVRLQPDKSSRALPHFRGPARALLG